MRMTVVSGDMRRARSGPVLRARLEGRRAEIEHAVITRVYAIGDSSGPGDPAYTDGLRAAVGAAIDYGLAAIDARSGYEPRLPIALLAQARLAVRSGVGLDTVLRRYAAGHALLTDFIVGAARESDIEPAELRLLLRRQSALLDSLLAAVGDEYAREANIPIDFDRQRRVERIKLLLAGELPDTSEFSYPFETMHLGLLASGAGGESALRRLGNLHDCRLLLVCPGDGLAWAWLGGRRTPDPAELVRELETTCPSGTTIAIGEPGTGLRGWRLTHRQAKAALPVAIHTSKASVRYADVALLASISQDDLLGSSLRQLYLKPLETGRDNGKSARETLRAYFAAGRNVSAAAAALGINRHTAASRIRAIERRLDRPLDSCVAELEAALSLEELRNAHPSRG
jgi:PucR C-terminal helix-turn-helix domain/GGDEF-like domain